LENRGTVPEHINVENCRDLECTFVNDTEKQKQIVSRQHKLIKGTDVTILLTIVFILGDEENCTSAACPGVPWSDHCEHDW